MPCGETRDDRTPAPAAAAIPQGARRGSRGLSRWLYYVSSIPTILLGMKSRWAVLRLFLGLPVRRPFVIRLSSGARFGVATRMDVWIVKESCLDKDYERDGPAVRNGWTVVDIGAGFGDFAVRVARECPDSVVYAFEPLPESFARLEENMRMNGVSNLRAFPQAITGRDGTIVLYTLTGLSGQHRTAADATMPSIAPAHVAPAITLAHAFAQHRIALCQFLKIDCEGAEYDILFNADADTLGRIEHIALEYHDAVTRHVHAELVSFLEGHGFRVRTRPSPAYHELGFLYASRLARAAAASPEGRRPE